MIFVALRQPVRAQDHGMFGRPTTGSDPGLVLMLESSGHNPLPGAPMRGQNAMTDAVAMQEVTELLQLGTPFGGDGLILGMDRLAQPVIMSAPRSRKQKKQTSPPILSLSGLLEMEALETPAASGAVPGASGPKKKDNVNVLEEILKEVFCDACARGPPGGSSRSSSSSSDDEPIIIPADQVFSLLNSHAATTTA